LNGLHLHRDELLSIRFLHRLDACAQLEPMRWSHLQQYLLQRADHANGIEVVVVTEVRDADHLPLHLALSVGHHHCEALAELFHHCASNPRPPEATPPSPQPRDTWVRTVPVPAPWLPRAPSLPTSRHYGSTRRVRLPDRPCPTCECNPALPAILRSARSPE